MDIKEKIFPCLNCGVDTGCPNKLTCDKCRSHQIKYKTLVRNKEAGCKNGRIRISDKKELQNRGHSL